MALIVNKDDGRIGPSETFLRAHMERLPFRTVSLVGNRGRRRLEGGHGAYLQSRLLVARGARWAMHRSSIRSTAAMDHSAVARYLRRERVDVTLAEYGPTAVSVMEACRRAAVPLVAHFHGWDAYVLATSPAHKASYVELFASAEAIIAVSRHMREHLIKLGSPAERTIWNPCGAEPAAQPADPQSAPPLFVAVGRATAKKALVVLLLAFAEVREQVPSARLELVGGEPDWVTRQLLIALGLTSSVHFHGPMQHPEVLALLQRARCYVHPSVTAPDGDMEGTPVSVLEAMGAGLPVVSTRHGGISDVLDGTSAGILTDEYDVAATAAGMLAYAADATKAARDGAEGRQLLIQRWSMSRSLASLARLVEAARNRDAQELANMALNA